MVFGAGTGNDVAAALRNHIPHVVAVELDPVIFRLGLERHPEHPYQDSRVTVVINDARYYLRMRHAPVDRIVMGWLDSHRLFSSLSNVRQDNFVYTVESMKQAHASLSDQGLLFVSFNVGRFWVGKKIFRMLEQAFGAPPRVFVFPGGGYGLAGQTFVAGTQATLASIHPPAGFLELTSDYVHTEPVSVPTDDWPYLYYQQKRLSPEYTWTIINLLLITVLVLMIVLRKEQIDSSTIHGLATFFFLGAAFMLLETKNLTSVALAFGSTWFVTSIVIGGVLIMALAANFLVEKGFPETLDKTWCALLAILIIAILWKDSWIPGGALSKGVATCLVTSLTFFFSTTVFSRLFAQTPIPSLALGANVLGGVVGGFTEYLNLLFGLRSLLVIAIGLYAVAWYFSRNIRRT